MSSILSLECVRSSRCLGLFSIRPEQANVVMLFQNFEFELGGKRCVCKYVEASRSREIFVLLFSRSPSSSYTEERQSLIVTR